MKYIALAIIALYRRVMYPIYRATGCTKLCRMTPSCSVYGEQAFRTHRFGTALVLTADRIHRCNGRSAGYADPVPSSPHPLRRKEAEGAAKTLLWLLFAIVVGAMAVRRSTR